MRGDNSRNSDYDLLLVFDRKINYPFKREIRDIIYDFMLCYDIVIDTTGMKPEVIVKDIIKITQTEGFGLRN